jgi:hypothetical protein
LCVVGGSFCKYVLGDATSFPGELLGWLEGEGRGKEAGRGDAGAGVEPTIKKAQT